MQFNIMVDPQSLTVLLVFTNDTYPSVGIFFSRLFKSSFEGIKCLPHL